MKKIIAVLGQGFVGGSLTTVMNERGFDVLTYDKAGNLAKGGWKAHIRPHYDANGELIDNGAHVKSAADLVEACEHQFFKPNFTGIYFVCLPTPMYEDGSADLSIVEETLSQLASVPGERIAVIKSTVPPGSTEKWNKQYEGTGLRIIFNPEFLTEANALDDMRNQNRIVLGGPRPHINKVKQIFQTAFPKVQIIKTSSSTAEMVKYVTNIHLAVKVALANEFYQICDKLDSEYDLNIDYDKVIEYALYDERLGKTHWQVPGPMAANNDTGKPAFGFGGSCFIKDINALIFLAKKINVNPTVMEGAWEKNLEVRPEKDWENLKGRAVSKKKI